MAKHIEITHEGVTRPLSEWAKVRRIKYHTLYARLSRGWSISQALGVTPRPKHCNYVIHGRSGSKEYKAWLAMKCRCSDSRRHNAHRYVGRGISVCAAWDNDFRAFFDHVGLAPSPFHSLGRIDNDRGYEPGNVRWETASEQARNRGTSCRRSVEC